MRYLPILILLPTLLFGADACMIKSTSTNTLISPALTSLVGPDFKSGYGIALDTLIVLDSASAARDSVSTVIFGPVDISAYNQIHAWCHFVGDTAYGNNDSLYKNSDGDTTHIFFQVSADNSNWYTITAAAALDSTILTHSTTMAQLLGLTRTASAATRLYLRFFRILAHYNITVGDQGASGTEDTSAVRYQYGYALWR